MSKISTIYDRIRVVVPGLTGFSTKTEIPNPYSLTDNNFKLLKDGYGITIGDGTPGPGEFKSFVEIREFGIVLARQVFSTTHNTDALVTISKSLLEDAFTIKKDFLNVDQLEIEESIELMSLGSSAPIDFVQAEKCSFVTTSVSILIQIREDL